MLMPAASVPATSASVMSRTSPSCITSTGWPALRAIPSARMPLRPMAPAGLPFTTRPLALTLTASVTPTSASNQSAFSRARKPPTCGSYLSKRPTVTFLSSSLELREPLAPLLRRQLTLLAVALGLHTSHARTTGTAFLVAVVLVVGVAGVHKVLLPLGQILDQLLDPLDVAVLVDFQISQLLAGCRLRVSGVVPYDLQLLTGREERVGTRHSREAIPVGVPLPGDTFQVLLDVLELGIALALLFVLELLQLGVFLLQSRLLLIGLGKVVLDALEFLARDGAGALLGFLAFVIAFVLGVFVGIFLFVFSAFVALVVLTLVLVFTVGTQQRPNWKTIGAQTNSPQRSPRTGVAQQRVQRHWVNETYLHFSSWDFGVLGHRGYARSGAWRSL